MRLRVSTWPLRLRRFGFAVWNASGRLRSSSVVGRRRFVFFSSPRSTRSDPSWMQKLCKWNNARMSMVGRRKRSATRELFSSSRQSQITDIRKIYTKSPAFLLSWSALSLHKWLAFILARYGRPSRSRGISSRTIKWMRYARAAGFDDSIGWTSVAA